MIGGGIMGTATACFLASDPAFDGRVVVLEADPTYARAATALSASSIRQQFSSAINVRCSQFGIEFLRGVPETLATEDGARVDIPIREGEILLLPPRVPHSPQRYANTVGLVIERKRRPDEQDGFLWYCEHCQYPLHAEYLHITDIEKQLPPVFDRFYSSLPLRTCQACGAVAHKR